jgi:hypothetical protein
MGFGHIIKRIITQEALQKGRITKLKQDRSREFILVLACILSIRKWILPLLIYKGESGDLIRT